MRMLNLARLKLRTLLRREQVEEELDEELRFHLEMQTEQNLRAGMSPRDARRRALVTFGGVEKHKEEVRDTRALASFRGLSLDLKLGTRMLVKYPGLTLVGGLAMAFAIWMAAGVFEFATQIVAPTLPLPDGDRIVALRNRDVAANRPEMHALHDFIAWREQLTSVEDLGAYREAERNLITAEGKGEPVNAAEISTSAFRVARVPALLGRSLTQADERPDASAVLVLGYDVWKTRFAADPAVVGRIVRLGYTAYTVVGIMPEGFAFPVSHNLWVPLRLNALDYGRRQGPEIHIFGRLARGATLDEARAELTTLGKRATAEFRDTHRHLRPEIMPYARSVVDVSGMNALAAMSVNLPLLMLLVLVCGNVALLMFARAATRESEIVVRYALGASRGRIVAQLFAEALVLGVLAAVLGLAAAGWGLRWVTTVIEADMLKGGKLPFWFDDRLSPTTLLYAALLTLVGAGIAGVLPALKVTRAVESRLRAASAGGGGLRFGGIWTAVIVAQVAVTVAFPASVLITQRDAAQIRAVEVAFPTEQYLSARLEMDREPPPGAPADTGKAAFQARFRTTYRELERRLAADPAVVGITHADRLPRMYHPHRLIEVDEGGAAPLHPNWPAYRVSSASVDPDFFRVVETPIRAGRGFHSGDLAAGGRTVIVNRSFVRLVLGDRNPIGRRLRYVHYEEWDDSKPREPGPWHEIVGVVGDMGMAVGADMGAAPGSDPKVAGIYHPVSPGATSPAHIAVHVRGDPLSFAPRLSAAAMATDPTLRLYDLTRLDQANESDLQFLAFWSRILMLVSAVALTLSLAGIYAVMSFTVSHRTREIGIRVALGASRRRIVGAIFRRPLTQVALGIVGGSVLVTLLAVGVIGTLTPKHVGMIVGYSAVMMAVCMLACIVPTRRALRVEPSEALRAE
jgi:predicted permease